MALECSRRLNLGLSGSNEGSYSSYAETPSQIRTAQNDPFLRHLPGHLPA